MVTSSSCLISALHACVVILFQSMFSISAPFLQLTGNPRYDHQIFSLLRCICYILKSVIFLFVYDLQKLRFLICVNMLVDSYGLEQVFFFTIILSSANL